MKKRWFSTFLFARMFQQMTAASSFTLRSSEGIRETRIFHESGARGLSRYQSTNYIKSYCRPRNRVRGTTALGAKLFNDIEDNYSMMKCNNVTLYERQTSQNELQSYSEEASLLGSSSRNGMPPSLFSRYDVNRDNKVDATDMNDKSNNQHTAEVVQSILNGIWNDLPPSSVLWLNLVAIIWGSQHAVIKMVVDDSDAGAFTLVRFGIGAIIATVFAIQTADYTMDDDGKGIADKVTTGVARADRASINSVGEERILSNASSSSCKPSDDNNTIDVKSNLLALEKIIEPESVGPTVSTAATTIRWGAEMGFWMFLGFAFQAVGLQFTTAQRSGFLLYLNVKFVPFLAYITMGRKISLPTWVSALAAFSGTALLAYDDSSSGGFFDLNAGDWWSIAAAAASAMFILRLEKASQKVTSAALLNAACLCVVTLLAAIWVIISTSTEQGLTFEWSQQVEILSQQIRDIIMIHPFEIFYLSAVTTALANYIQTKAQKDVPAERASVIYAMDPVYGAVFSNFILGETLSSFGYAGAGIITLAAATNAFLDLSVAETETETETDTTEASFSSTSIDLSSSNMNGNKINAESRNFNINDDNDEDDEV